jgi:hypothetical protein
MNPQFVIGDLVKFNWHAAYLRPSDHKGIILDIQQKKIKRRPGFWQIEDMLKIYWFNTKTITEEFQDVIEMYLF